QAEKFSDELTADIDDDRVVPSLAIPTEGGKIRIRVFVSYAHTDKKLAAELLAVLKEEFAPSPYSLHLWVDQDIMTGEGWHDRIQKAIADCDFGIMLLSPGF